MSWIKIEKEKGTDTKIIKTEADESREMSWLDLEEVTHADIADWTWLDLIIFTTLWTKVLKETGDWEKVGK